MHIYNVHTYFYIYTYYNVHIYVLYHMFLCICIYIHTCCTMMYYALYPPVRKHGLLERYPLIDDFPTHPLLYTMWRPTVISWFVSPPNYPTYYSYNYHRPYWGIPSFAWHVCIGCDSFLIYLDLNKESLTKWHAEKIEMVVYTPFHLVVRTHHSLNVM